MNPRDPYTEVSGVLRNRLGITDQNTLEAVERAAAFQRIVQLEQNPIDGVFDFGHLQAIHRYILQDVYEWAGELRTSDTGAFGIPHARPQFLTEELDRVFAQIAAGAPSTTSDYLADQLRHAVYAVAEVPDGTLSATQGGRSTISAAEHFRAMREHRASGTSAPYRHPPQV